MCLRTRITTEAAVIHTCTPLNTTLSTAKDVLPSGRVHARNYRGGSACKTIGVGIVKKEGLPETIVARAPAKR